MPAKPTIPFVPGARHTEFHAKLVPRNHNGAETKPVLQDSVEKVFKAMRVEAESGRDFVVLGHSAGGLVSAMAVNKFLPSATAEEKSRLKRVIFLAAFIRTSKHIISHWHHMDFKKGLSWPLRPEQVFYNDMSIEESKPYCEALLPMTLTPRPDEIDSLWHEIPRVFIVASKDEALLPYKQREEAEEQGFDIFELDSGHCPSISQPDNFANVLNGIIQQGLEAKT